MLVFGVNSIRAFLTQHLQVLRLLPDCYKLVDAEPPNVNGQLSPGDLV